MKPKTNPEISFEIGDRIGNSLFAIETFVSALEGRFKREEFDKAAEVLPGINKALESAKIRLKEICAELDRPLRIGITGGIACGKSTVGDKLAELGALVIDTDHLGHELLSGPNPTYDAILARFGNIATTPGGPIDRKQLGAIVFSNPDALRDLNSIMHPAINALMLQRMAQHRPGQVVAVLVPLLFETNLDQKGYFDEIWTIAVEKKVQLERLMKRNGFTEAEALKRINAQMRQSEKIKRANRVIDNSGSRRKTHTQVKERLKVAMKKAHLA